MAGQTSIEWTNATWNPLTGCTKVSEGCVNCYAERIAMRLCAAGNKRYKHGFKVTLHEDLLDVPLRWKTPRLIFVNSMSDLFHEAVHERFITSVFDTMRKADWHRFQILTKRSKRLLEMAPHIDWPDNVWMGVTVEGSRYCERIDHLRKVAARVRFVSFEPLLDQIIAPNLSLIHWAIIGGESGPHARPMKIEWVRVLRDEIIKQRAAFFFKQWGGPFRKRNGRLLDGMTWDQMPFLDMPPSIP